MPQTDYCSIPKDPLQPTIFHETWWLRIATEDRYAVAEVVDHGQIVARLPYLLKRRLGIRVVGPPHFTHFLGPAIVNLSGKQMGGQSRHAEILNSLLEQLPRASRFKIHCHRDITDVTAFQAHGFVATVQFTREVQPQSVDDVWVSLRKKARNNILSAERLFSIESNLDPDSFTVLYKHNLQEKDEKNHLDMNICRKLLRAAKDRDRCSILGARDKQGRLIAAIACVSDHAVSYWLMCTRPTDANRGAISMLVWHAIKQAMEKGLIFDFDGFVSEGAVRFSAGFSSIVTPRYIVTRNTIPAQLLLSLRSTIKKPNYFYI